MRSCLGCVAVGFGLSLIGVGVWAQGFVQPDSFGWSRGDAHSTYAEWDDFASAVQPNAPDIGMFPVPLPAGWTPPTVQETTGTAFLTSTGNIYSFTTVLEFEVQVPAEPMVGGTTTVLLQTKTLGREIDPATIVCDGQGPVEVVELYRFNLGPDDIFGGDLVETLWRFEVPADGTMTITFESLDTSVSLDAVAVDTFSVPATCLADVNQNGTVEPADFSAWIAAFNTGSPLADQNQNGTVEPADFSAWIANFNAGCP